MPKKKNSKTVKTKALANNYADIYLLPIPRKNLARYKKVASRFGKMAREYGALDYREMIADDLFPKGMLSFEKPANPKKDEIVIAAVVDFNSRKHRDTVIKRMFKDPRMDKMMKEDQKNPIADMTKMYCGGFKTIVKA